MGDQFRVEAPMAADAAAIARVHVQGWREAYGTLLPERFYDDAALERRTRWWSGQLEDPSRPHTIQVARSAEGEVIGFAVSGPSRTVEGVIPLVDDEVYAIYVLADWYGGGAGQALLEAVVGQRPAELWVARDNPRARAFYARNGFVPDGAEIVDDELDGLVEVRLVRGHESETSAD